MAFSKWMVGAVAATTVASTGFAVAPAQAFELKGSITLTGNAVVRDYFTGAATQDLELGLVSGVNGEGHFAGLSLNNISIAKMQITRLSSDGSMGLFTLQPKNPAIPFVDFGTRTIDGLTRTLQFILSPNQTINVLGNKSTVGNLLNLSFSNIFDPLDGYFLFGEQTLAKGSIAATRAGNSPSTGGFTLSLTADPIPTPALLPGMVALGAGFLRKRKTLNAQQSSKA